jgi:hypothetical protein
MRKEQREQRKKYEDRRVDEQHGAVTRRMKRDERKANKFNEKRSQALSRSAKDDNKMHFSLGWIFHRDKSKPQISGSSEREANKFNSNSGAYTQSAKDFNKPHFALGWLFSRKNRKPDINGGSLKKSNSFNSAKPIKSQSARDANKAHFSLGWLFRRGNRQNKGGGEHRSYNGKN